MIVTVNVRGEVGDLETLEVTVRDGTDSGAASFGVTGKSFPQTFSVTADGRDGPIELEVAGTSGGLVTAFGRGQADLVDGDEVTATVRLDPADFVVNTVTAGGQQPVFRSGRNGRQIAAAPDGQFAVSFVTDCTPPDCSLFVRLFDAAGRPVENAVTSSTDEFAANTTASLVSVPSIALGTGGEIGLSWETPPAIRATVLGADGTAVPAADAQVTVAAVNDVRDPAIAALAAGSYAIGWWQERNSPDENGMYGTLLTSGGVVNPPFLMAETDDGQNVSVASLGNANGFVAVWTDIDQIFMYSTQSGAAGGTLIAIKRVVGASFAGVGVAVDDNLRGYAAAGLTVPGDNPLSAGGLTLSSFSATTGVLLGDQVVVDPFPATATPAIAIGDNGDIAVAWHNCGDDGDGDGCGIFVQRFDPDTLSPLADPVRVNTATAGDQRDPSIAAVPGGYVLTWTDFGPTLPDDSAGGVRARLVFSDAL